MKFKKGDRVVFNLDSFDGIESYHNKKLCDLDRGVFTVKTRTKDGLTLDRRVFKYDTHSAGWPDYHFKLAKNQIVSEIIKDL